MPIPRIIARTNRTFPNPLVRQFAGKVAPLALLIHRGRTSGKEYCTPIVAFPTGDGFVMALTYGRNTDWERNVLHEGGCVLVYRDKKHSLAHPEFVEEGEADRFLPAPARLALRVIRVHDFLRLHRSSSP